MDQLLEQITGEVESVIYQNEENGYTVARVFCDDGQVLTVVGILPCLGAGERLSAEGTLTSHPQHGPNFRWKATTGSCPRRKRAFIPTWPPAPSRASALKRHKPS